MAHTLMVSISGIRGIFGAGLDPAVLVHYTAAYGTWCRQQAAASGRTPVVVVGRDARVTGELCARIVLSTLQGTGCHVVDAGLATTPTVEMGVLAAQAVGGVILSASHNPAEWNALKLLNGKGEFLSPEEGAEVIRIADAGEARFVAWDQIGTYRAQEYLGYHLDAILALPYLHPEQIAARDFRVVVDGINSVGAIALPALLHRLGVRDEQIILLNGEPNGRFAHGAEPLPENLAETIRAVGETGADLGLVVDPDADRLALIENGGQYLSEELTQVVAADFIWRFRPGPFVTNLSSSRAIDDLAHRYGVAVYRSAVGEVNVVRKMQEVGAVLGGEGNGGVIVPELHYGRDALAGAALVLQHLANEGRTLAEVRAALPRYAIAKHKLSIAGLNPDTLLAALAQTYRHERISTVDGLKIDFDEGWVHLRKSNTEPILRIYSDATTAATAQALGERFMAELQVAGSRL
jgi:phosphomannomutase